MYTNLPIISTAGLFQSRDKFSDSRKYPDNSITHLRTVTDYELELFTRDGGTSHLNGRSYPIRKGCLLIAKPGDKRQSTLHYTALFIHFGTCDRAVQELLHSVCGFHCDMDFDALAPALEEICQITLSFEPDSNLLAAAKLIEFLCQIKKNCFMNPISDSSTSGRSAVSDAIEYMKQYYMEPLSIARIAEHCCLSSSYLYKIFLDTVHTTPNNYLLKLRLAAAKSLLATTTLPVSEIAVKCGFNSQAYFSDCFKRQFSVSPRQFRSAFLHPDIN